MLVDILFILLVIVLLPVRAQGLENFHVLCSSQNKTSARVLGKDNCPQHDRQGHVTWVSLA